MAEDFPYLLLSSLLIMKGFEVLKLSDQTIVPGIAWQPFWDHHHSPHFVVLRYHSAWQQCWKECRPSHIHRMTVLKWEMFRDDDNKRNLNSLTVELLFPFTTPFSFVYLFAGKMIIYVQSVLFPPKKDSLSNASCHLKFIRICKKKTRRLQCTKYTHTCIKRIHM